MGKPHCDLLIGAEQRDSQQSKIEEWHLGCCKIIKGGKLCLGFGWIQQQRVI